MSAPVVGFTAECPKGLNGWSFIEVEMLDDDALIEITLSPLDATGLAIRDRCLIVTHDEARQIIGGLASVIT